MRTLLGGVVFSDIIDSKLPNYQIAEKVFGTMSRFNARTVASVSGRKTRGVVPTLQQGALAAVLLLRRCCRRRKVLSWEGSSVVLTCLSSTA